jgi:hypothetical protein
VPRPRVDAQGKVVPEADLRKLWVVARDVGINDEFYKGVAYLTQDGRWGPLDLAAAWYEKDKALAEDAAASAVLSDPAMFFGKVRVLEILG